MSLQETIGHLERALEELQRTHSAITMAAEAIGPARDAVVVLTAGSAVSEVSACGGTLQGLLQSLNEARGRVGLARATIEDYRARL